MTGSTVEAGGIEVTEPVPSKSRLWATSMTLRHPEHRSPKTGFDYRWSAFVDRGLTINDRGHGLNDRVLTRDDRECAFDHRSLTLHDCEHALDDREWSLDDRECAFDHRWLTLDDRECALDDRFHTNLGRVGRRSFIHNRGGPSGEPASVARGHTRATVAIAHGVRPLACSRTRGRRARAR